MAKNPKIELPLRNDFGILCDPKIVPNTNLDTVCFTLPGISINGSSFITLIIFGSSLLYLSSVEQSKPFLPLMKSGVEVSKDPLRTTGINLVVP